MREAELFPPVKAWLEAQGYAVYAEIPFYSSNVDVVGRRGDELVAVELKMSLTHQVIHQAALCDLFTGEAYAGVATRPRNLQKAKDAGIGVLSIRDGEVKVVLLPRLRYRAVVGQARRIRAFCVGDCDLVGGLPNLEGQGPAQDCERRVKEHREAHPNATWREIYAAVPNHYASHQSMRNALTCGLRQRRHWKALAQKAREHKAAVDQMCEGTNA